MLLSHHRGLQQNLHPNPNPADGRANMLTLALLHAAAVIQSVAGDLSPFLKKSEYLTVKLDKQPSNKMIWQVRYKMVYSDATLSYVINNIKSHIPNISPEVQPDIFCFSEYLR